MMPAIPQVLALLMDHYGAVRWSATDVFWKLIDNREWPLCIFPCILPWVTAVFHEAMKPAIPQVIALLTDPDWDVRQSATNVFGKLADHGKWPIEYLSMSFSMSPSCLPWSDEMWYSPCHCTSHGP
jgi:hypothetical protein